MRRRDRGAAVSQGPRSRQYGGKSTDYLVFGSSNRCSSIYVRIHMRVNEARSKTNLLCSQDREIMIQRAFWRLSVS